MPVRSCRNFAFLLGLSGLVSSLPSCGAASAGGRHPDSETPAATSREPKSQKQATGSPAAVRQNEPAQPAPESTATHTNAASTDAAQTAGPASVSTRSSTITTSPRPSSAWADAHSLGQLDHPKGEPVTGYCDLGKVPWKSTPEILGLEGLLQVKDEEEAAAKHTRSYMFTKIHTSDTDRDKVEDLATIVTLHFAPTAEGTLYRWGEITFLISRNCTLQTTQVLILSFGQGTEPKQR